MSNLSKGVKTNFIVYALCMFIAAIGILFGLAIKQDYSSLRIFDYNNLLLLILGIPFLLWQSKAYIPDFLDTGISSRQRFIKPVLIGFMFGLMDVIVYKCVLHPEPYTSLPPYLQPFPYSLFLYFSGAFEIEVFYRLIPLTLILWLGNWALNGKYFNVFFWTGVILTSIREPLEQMPDGSLLVMSYSVITGLIMNLIQGISFKNAGFLASLSLRLGHYLFWHILLGIYVQYFELL
jgi:hypothetical protein